MTPEKYRVVLQSIVDNLEVTRTALIPDKDQLMWGRKGAQYCIFVCQNSYDEAAIGWFRGLLEYARNELMPPESENENG